MEKLEKKNGNGSKKFKFLFVSHEGLIGDLAWQVKKEGNEVKYFIHKMSEKNVCDGFVEKCDAWEKFVDWADVIVFDDTGFGGEADMLRKEGKSVIGASAYGDMLESDREFGQDELKKAGVNILPHWDFTDFDVAVRFIKEHPGRYVLKPNGKAQNEKELLFVGEEDDGQDVIEVLELYKKNWAKKIKNFQIQKHAKGVEVAIGAFFNGKDFITPVFINFEHKRMFPGDIGPSTGEMGTSAYWCPPNKIFEETMAKMKAPLAASGYTGYIDINCIVNGNGIYPLEFTSRFGYPTISLQIEGITSPWGEFLNAMAKGQDYQLKTKGGFQLCVVIAVPPFPFHDPESFRKYSEDATIIFKRPQFEGIHLCDTKLVDGDWRLAGVSGYALVVTGAGPTMEMARRQAYQRIQNIKIPNMFYRTDIGYRWMSDSDRLQGWGYLY